MPASFGSLKHESFQISRLSSITSIDADLIELVELWSLDSHIYAFLGRSVYIPNPRRNIYTPQAATVFYMLVGTLLLRSSLRIDGLISAAGLIGKNGGYDSPRLLDALRNVCVVRGALLGSRQQFRNTNTFIETHDVKPAINDEILALMRKMRLKDWRHRNISVN